MSTTVQSYPALISDVEAKKNAIVLILLASRTDENENIVSITDAQMESAMYAAKSVLQCVGADVAASASSLNIPAVELNDGETLSLQINTELVKQGVEQ